jgi:hypothetical protein
MDLEEFTLCQCVGCGADIDVTADRYYASSDTDETVLCFECAIARGGVYDENHDTWTVPPDASLLPDERRPHA